MTQIEKIESILEYFEGGKLNLSTYEEGALTNIYKMIDKLKESPDKYLAAYKNYLEFVLPLLQRTTIRDTGNKPDLKGL